MSKRLDENIGAVEYDGLIVNNVPVADVVTVKLAAGTGILKRGTVVTGAAGAELAPAAAALSATNGTYILTDDTDVTAGAVVPHSHCKGLKSYLTFPPMTKVLVNTIIFAL